MAIERAIPFACQHARRIGWSNSFAAENAHHAHFFSITRSPMVLAQAVAQLRQQGVMGRSSQIVDLYFVGQAFPPCRPHRDQAMFA